MKITIGKGFEKVTCEVCEPDSWFDWSEQRRYRIGWEIAIGYTYYLKPSEAKKLHAWLGKAIKHIEKAKRGME